MNDLHPSFLQLDRVALGDVRDPSIQQHVDSCEQCQVHVKTVQRVDVTPAWVRELSQTRSKSARPWLWASFASVVMATAIVFLFLRTPKQTATKFTTVKGAASVAVHIKRGNQVRLWDHQSKLMPADALRIEVMPEEHRYVGVFAERIDDNHVQHIELYSGSLRGDGSTVLPRAWKVDAEPGPETMIVVMSPFPVSPALLLESPEVLIGKGIWVQTLTFHKDIAQVEQP